MENPNFKKFLTNLSKNSQNLTKEQIAEKIIDWVDNHAVDQESEAALLTQVYSTFSSKKLKNSVNVSYYLDQIHSAFDPIDASDPDLEWIFDQLSHMSKLSNYYSRASTIYSQIVSNIEGTDWELAKKRMVARKLSRHFQGTAQEILAKNKPVNLSAEKHAAIITYFTKKVSSKNYKRYFKNIEKGVGRPEEWMAILRFEYHNRLVFALRALKNNFLDTLKSGLIGSLIIFTILFALIVIPTLSMEGVVALVALLTLKGISNLVLFSLSTLIVSLPVIALSTLHDNFVDSIMLIRDIVYLAIPALVVSLSFIASFLVEKLAPEEANPDLVPEPKSAPGPDPLAAVPENSNKAVQSKKEKSLKKKENNSGEPVLAARSSKRRGCKASKSTNKVD